MICCGGGWTFSQNFSSLALTVCDLWGYGGNGELTHWLTELINDEAVYRTAPATPGLWNTFINNAFDTNSRCFHKNLLKPWIRLQVFWLSSLAYKLVNLFVFEKTSCKMSKNWIFFLQLLVWDSTLSMNLKSVLVYIVQWSSVSQPVEGALVFLSLWRESWCYSVWVMKHFLRLLFCLTPPEEVVLIVRQGGPNCPTKWF